ncbi:MAG: translation elongation factor Ts [Alphaproteobacteria bacterium]|nr:translation elongation factor Ts [Alphaproteobacteria bacterium]
MSMELIKDLRGMTGAGVLDCKKALAENGNDLQAAADWLRAKGIANAAKKAGRIAAEGLVGHYIHDGGRIAVLVEVNCETDFVAQNEGFQDLVRDLAMHIASERPLYVDKDDVPESDVEAERKVQLERTMNEGKPAAIAEKMVEGRMRKWFEEVVLLDQKFIKDDSKTIRDLMTDAVSRIGENIKIRRFARFEVGEGLEKRSEDFAAEVAAAVKG